MDAGYFRYRAEWARELACLGEDQRLAQMLLQVAFDMEAEAEVIEAASRQLWQSDNVLA